MPLDHSDPWAGRERTGGSREAVACKSWLCDLGQVPQYPSFRVCENGDGEIVGEVEADACRGLSTVCVRMKGKLARDSQGHRNPGTLTHL